MGFAVTIETDEGAVHGRLLSCNTNSVWVVDDGEADVILPLVAAVFGTPDFDALVLTVNGAQIRYGAFLTAFVSFLLLAFTIMLLVQAVRRATGREAAGAQGSRECDHCKSFIPVDASVCMFCTRDVDPIVS